MTLLTMDLPPATMNQTQPYAEAIAIKHDKIVQVGTNEDIKPWIGKNTKVIDLKGKTGRRHSQS